MPRFAWVLCLFMAATVCAAEDNSPLLLQKPALSRTQIVFVYAGDLWSVARDASSTGVPELPFASGHSTLSRSALACLRTCGLEF